jgi:hypothetical protein
MVGIIFHQKTHLSLVPTSASVLHCAGTASNLISIVMMIIIITITIIIIINNTSTAKGGRGVGRV